MPNAHRARSAVLHYPVCHIISGLIVLTLSATLVGLQCLFWIHFVDDPHWSWPHHLSLVGFGTAGALIVHAVLLLLAGAVKSRPLLVASLIFGCIGVLYCVTVGVRNSLEYASADEDSRHSSVVTMATVNLVAGAYVLIYLIVICTDLCYCRTSGAMSHERTAQPHTRTRSNPVHVAGYSAWSSSSSPRVTYAPQFPAYPLPSAPTEPPPYQL